MDAARFDRLARSLVSSQSRRSVLLLTFGGAASDFFADQAHAGKGRKKKRKKRPGNPCRRCADNEECVRGKCVSLARGCRVEDDSCATGENIPCGQANDPVEERAFCGLTLGDNPICPRARSIHCRSCTSHQDCEQQGWGPRGVCLSRCRIRCGEGGPPSCAVPYGEPCRAPGEVCAEDDDCCSQRCRGALCRMRPPFCGGPSMLCKDSLECCSGTCGWPSDPYCGP